MIRTRSADKHKRYAEFPLIEHQENAALVIIEGWYQEVIGIDVGTTGRI